MGEKLSESKARGTPTLCKTGSPKFYSEKLRPGLRRLEYARAEDIYETPPLRPRWILY